MGAESEQMDDGALLDLLFVQDATASMSPYIQSAKNNILEICEFLLASGRLQRTNGLQVGLLAYRDYPAEENGFVTKSEPFTYDLCVMRDYLAPLTAHGGGDLPEAFSTALEHACTNTTGWRDEALKAIVIVTDAAPHGINEKPDSFPDGAPRGVSLRDPLELAREKAEEGYHFFVLACEPTLGENTRYAVDFYRALTERTLGAFCPLTDHKVLATCIIGSLLERIDLSRLSDKYKHDIARLVNKGQPFDAIVDELYKRMTDAGEQATTMQTPNIYNDPAAAKHNYNVFMSSDTLADARKTLKKVYPQRVNPGCMKAARQHNKIADAETNGGFVEVTIRIKNLGASRIVFSMYDAELSKMSNDVILPDGFITIKKFRINVPVNFVLERGSKTKNFSRTFEKDEDLDLHFVFENS